MENKQNNGHKSITELAALLQVDRSTVWEWIKAGHVKAYRRGPTQRSPYIIPAEEVARLLELYRVSA